MRKFYNRIIFAGIALIWLKIAFYLFFEIGEKINFALPAFLLFAVFVFATIKGPSKKTSVAGKIFIAAGLFSAVSLIIKDGLNIDIISGFVTAGIIASGIYLDAVSPRKKLKTWMFLAMSTKAEFLFVAGAISVSGMNNAYGGFFPPESWWVLVLMMVASVPLLALKKKAFYRAAVLMTTIVALIFFLDFAVGNPGARWTLLLISTIFIWPAVTERMIGRRVFLNKY